MRKDLERRNGMNDVKADLSEMSIQMALMISKSDSNHISLRSSIDQLLEKVERHDHTLYGNGNKGLTERVGAIEELKKELKEHKDIDRNAFIGIYGAMIGILFGIVKLVFFK